VHKIYVIHENDAWVEPLRAALARQGWQYEEWFLAGGAVDLQEEPPEGVFYNRMSASSHIRGHRLGPEHAGVVLGWLERHGRRVVNDSRALRLEVSKALQYSALRTHGIRTPRTVVAVGREAIPAAADAFASGPILLKPNRGGSGAGVQLFETRGALAAFLTSDAFEPSIDGVSLLQEYVRSPEDVITRVEFIGGRFFYAVQVDTRGGFELCPADHCVEPGGVGYGARRPMFSIIDEIDPALTLQYEAFLAAHGIEIGALEFVRDAEGRAYTYDVNTNTNYNRDAEARAGRWAWDEVTRFLGEEVERVARGGSPQTVVVGR
jgi:hypothetical protein